MKFVNRSLVVALLFAMTGVGVTFAAGTNSTQNFLLGGNTGLTGKDVNQVLTLLVGADGKPGAPGAAGAVGPAGPAGPAGAAGAQGPAGATGGNGKDGVSVTTGLLNVGDANCPTGGVSVASASGTAYICNGKQGAAGANGANGANGTNGTNGTGGGGGVGTGYGAGTLTAGTCDDSVDVQLKHTFAGGKFSLNQIIASNLKAACASTTFKVTFSIRGTGSLYGTGALASEYAANDEVVCSKVVTGANWTGAGDARTFSIEASDAVCKVGTGTSFALSELSARDINDAIGFELG